MTVAERLEKTYGVSIVKSAYYNPFSSKLVNSYDIFSADGCTWEKGLPTLKACEKECKNWVAELIKIKKNVGVFA